MTAVTCLMWAESHELICPDKVTILDPDVRPDTPSSVTPCQGVIRVFYFLFSVKSSQKKYYIRREMGGVGMNYANSDSSSSFQTVLTSSKSLFSIFRSALTPRWGWIIMTFYKAVTRGWRKWGLAQQRLALSQCQGNNNWAGMRTRGREGVKIRRDVSNWQLNFLCFLSEASLHLQPGEELLQNLQIFCEVTFMMPLCVWDSWFSTKSETIQPTDFLSFHWLKSLGNLLWPIVTPRGWKDNRQLLKMFCAAVSLVSDCYVELKF